MNIDNSNESCNEFEYQNPCGAYNFVTVSGIAKSGTLGENLNKDQILSMFNLSDTSRLNMKKTYINYRNPETNQFEVVFGCGKPESYDAFIGSINK